MPIRPFEPADTDAVIALWQAAGLTRPWNDPRRDIARKCAEQADGFFVACDDGQVVGSVMAGYDGHRGWMNYLAVSPAARGRGHARALVAQAEAWLFVRGCPKLNLQVRSDNHAVLDFYRHLGYAVDDVVSMGKRLVRDTAS